MIRKIIRTFIGLRIQKYSFLVNDGSGDKKCAKLNLRIVKTVWKTILKY